MSDREALANVIESIEGADDAEVQTLKNVVEGLRAGVRNALSVGRTWNGSQVEFEVFLLANLKPEDQYALAELYIEEGEYHSVMRLLKLGDVSIKKQVLLDFITTTASYPFKYFYSGGKIYEEAVRSLLDKEVALAFTRFAGETDFFSKSVQYFSGLDKEVGLKWAEAGEEVCVSENLDRFPGLTLLDIAQVLHGEDKNTEEIAKLDKRAAEILIEKEKGGFVCRNIASFEGVNQREIADKLMENKSSFIDLLNHLGRFDGVDHAYVVERFYQTIKEGHSIGRGGLICIRIAQINSRGRERLRELMLANGEELEVLYYFVEFGMDESEAVPRLVELAKDDPLGHGALGSLAQLIEMGKVSKIDKEMARLLLESQYSNVLDDHSHLLQLTDEDKSELSEFFVCRGLKKEAWLS